MSDEKNNQEDWKSKFNDLVQTCQTELKKTTQIGMKMLSASQSNSDLRETYEEIGILVKKLVEKDEIKTENETIRSLIEKAKVLEEKLQGFESEVQDLKKN